jgi:hypothetical protein
MRASGRKAALKIGPSVLALLLASIPPVHATGVVVSDEATALTIGRAALIRVYGKTTIRGEEPLVASRHGDEWYVRGTLHCPVSALGGCLGGSTFVAISAQDGHVIRTFRTK